MNENFIMNRKANALNPYQGIAKKVLCVCSAGLLRSPTAAFILSQEPFNFNTRACGMEERFALIAINEVLIHWADEIVCMDEDQKDRLKKMTDKPIVCLRIKDSYGFKDPKLMEMIHANYIEQ